MAENDLIKGAKAASDYLGGVVTVHQVYHLAENGELPVIRKGKRLYFRKSELEAAFQSDKAA